MNKQMYRVVKVTVKSGCDLDKVLVKSNLTKPKAQALRSDLENKLGDFSPEQIVSYLMEPA